VIEFADLVHVVDDGDAHAEGYVTLFDVESAGGQGVEAAILACVLLIDHRSRFDQASGETQRVTLCRLNRRHPLVQQLTGW